MDKTHNIHVISNTPELSINNNGTIFTDFVNIIVNHYNLKLPNKNIEIMHAVMKVDDRTKNEMTSVGIIYRNMLKMISLNMDAYNIRKIMMESVDAYKKLNAEADESKDIQYISSIIMRLWYKITNILLLSSGIDEHNIYKIYKIIRKTIDAIIKTFNVNNKLVELMENIQYKKVRIIQPRILYSRVRYNILRSLYNIHKCNYSIVNSNNYNEYDVYTRTFATTNNVHENILDGIEYKITEDEISRFDTTKFYKSILHYTKYNTIFINSYGYRTEEYKRDPVIASITYSDIFTNILQILLYITILTRIDYMYVIDDYIPYSARISDSITGIYSKTYNVIKVGKIEYVSYMMSIHSYNTILKLIQNDAVDTNNLNTVDMQVSLLYPMLLLFSGNGNKVLNIMKKMGWI